MRINQYLSRCGLGSRRGVEALVSAGRVTVNGQPAALGTAVQPSDDVRLDGKPAAPESLQYYAMNKPSNLITAMADPEDRPCVGDVLRRLQLPPSIVPVGRLDRDSEGLLLLTNDGPLANALTHPSCGVQKVYETTVKGDISAEALAQLRAGVVLDDGYKTFPAQVALLRRTASGAVINITLHEGHNRQVRRMCQAVRLPVFRLVRTAVGPVRLGRQAVGAVRELTAAEVKTLIELTIDNDGAHGR